MHFTSSRLVFRFYVIQFITKTWSSYTEFHRECYLVLAGPISNFSTQFSYPCLSSSERCNTDAHNEPGLEFRAIRWKSWRSISSTIPLSSSVARFELLQFQKILQASSLRTYVHIQEASYAFDHMVLLYVQNNSRYHPIQSSAGTVCINDRVLGRTGCNRGYSVLSYLVHHNSRHVATTSRHFAHLSIHLM